MHRIAASILSAGRPQLPDAVRRLAAAGIDAVHLNVVQAEDRPNFDLAHLACASIRAASALPLHVHLRVPASAALIERFAEAGADLLIVHADPGADLRMLLDCVRSAGCRAGLAIGPAAGAAGLARMSDCLPLLELVHVSCTPDALGAGRFQTDGLLQIRDVRRLLGPLDGRVRLQADGDIGPANVAAVSEAGADDIVIGRALFTSQDWAGTVAGLRAAFDAAPAPASQVVA